MMASIRFLSHFACRRFPYSLLPASSPSTHLLVLHPTSVQYLSDVALTVLPHSCHLTLPSLLSSRGPNPCPLTSVSYSMRLLPLASASLHHSSAWASVAAMIPSAVIGTPSPLRLMSISMAKILSRISHNLFLTNSSSKLYGQSTVLNYTFKNDNFGGWG